MKAPITFDEPSHTYTHNETGEKYTSVTTLLGKYKKPFDADGMSKHVARFAADALLPLSLSPVWAT